MNMEPCFYRMASDFLKTDYLFLAVGVVGGACSDVEQTFAQVTKFSKREQLLDLLKTTGKACQCSEKPVNIRINERTRISPLFNDDLSE